MIITPMNVELSNCYTSLTVKGRPPIQEDHPGASALTSLCIDIFHCAVVLDETGTTNLYTYSLYRLMGAEI